MESIPQDERERLADEICAAFDARYFKIMNDCYHDVLMIIIDRGLAHE